MTRQVKGENRLSIHTLRSAAARKRPLHKEDERPNFRDLGTVPPAALTPLTEQQGKLARQYDEEEEAWAQFWFTSSL
jgi:hypothetical protein